MARWGKVDFRELKEFQKKLEKMEKAVSEEFIEACAKELTARLLAKVIERTKPGQYPAGSGKTGGTLKRGWTAKTEAEAISSKSNKNARRYANALPVVKRGRTFEIEVINPVHYASYVEFGHRTSNHKGWVLGKFMLTLSEQELEAEAPGILEKKLLKHLGEVFDGK